MARVRLRTIVLLLGAALLWTGHTGAQPGGERRHPPDRYDLDDVVMRLERTPCFGRCPAYVLTIRGTGSCTYVGRSGVRVTGERRFRLDRDKIVEVLNRFYDIDFFALGRDYGQRRMIEVTPDGEVRERLATITDVPSEILTLRIGSWRKTITKNSISGPKDLSDLASEMDRAAGSERWTKDSGRRPDGRYDR